MSYYRSTQSPTFGNALAVRKHRSAALIALIFGGVALSVGCSPGVADPAQGLAVAIKGPLVNSPFEDPNVAFVKLTAEGPDLKDDTAVVSQPYAAGKPLTLPSVPYGPARQILVELYGRGVNGELVPPALARGRTIRQDVTSGETFLIHAYVTKTNAFTPPVTNQKTSIFTDPRVGASVVATGDGSVLIAGGAAPVAGATDPHDPKSWGSFSNVLLRYGVDQRQLYNLSAPPINAKLSTGRAFMASAAGKGGLIAFSGGFVDKGAGPVPSPLMEYFDPKTSKVLTSTAGRPHLTFARAHHTITRMFDNDDYFIVMGGMGDSGKALDTWEIWHPAFGQVTQGRLSGPRYNHAAVRVPAPDGGYVMLVGGENDAGTINTFEVIRFSRNGTVANQGSPKVTCCLGTTCYDGPDSTAQCAAAKGQPGYANEYRWQPLVQPLKGGVGRTLPAAAYVNTSAAGYTLVYMVGGFSDKAKKTPLANVDVFNISTGQWVTKTTPLQAPRGAPVLGWSTVGKQRGQVIVTGGLDAAGKTIASGELLSYDVAGDEILRAWASNELPNGGRVFAGVTSLSTGQVLIAGGASSSGNGLLATTSIQLYNPK